VRLRPVGGADGVLDGGRVYAVGGPACTFKAGLRSGISRTGDRAGGDELHGESEHGMGEGAGAGADSPGWQAAEPHAGGIGQRLNWLRAGLNWLRAGVLGANDGIVSTAGLVVGVAAVTPEPGPILTAGIAGLVAGAVSMALGEYVSVSSQRDTERALLAKEKAELEDFPEQELDELAAIYVAKGASVQTARKLAEELTAHDAFAAHADAELGIDPQGLTNPWHAAVSSAVAFTVGSILPIVAILSAPSGIRVAVTFAVVLLALAFTGALSASLGGARWAPAIGRLVVGGAAAMAVTYGIGQLVGAVGL